MPMTPADTLLDNLPETRLPCVADRWVSYPGSHGYPATRPYSAWVTRDGGGVYAVVSETPQAPGQAICNAPEALHFALLRQWASGGTFPELLVIEHWPHSAHMLTAVRWEDGVCTWQPVNPRTAALFLHGLDASDLREGHVRADRVRISATGAGWREAAH